MELRRAAEPVLAGAVAFVVAASAVPVLIGDVPVPPPASTILLATGVGLLFAAVLVTLVTVLGRRERAKRELIRTAVRTGRLPDMDHAVLHRMLWERSVRLRSWRWTWLALGALEVVVVGSHFLQRTGEESIYSRILWALEIAIWVGLTATRTTQAWRERPKVERLLDELDARTAQHADA